MRVQIVHHQRDPRGIVVMNVRQLLDLHREVHFRPTRRYVYVPPSTKRFDHHEQIGRPVSHVLVVATLHGPGAGRDRLADFAH